MRRSATISWSTIQRGCTGFDANGRGRLSAAATIARGDHRNYLAWREKYEISTGRVTRITSGASIMPVTTTTASGFCTCDPIPADIAAGSRPTPATTHV